MMLLTVRTFGSGSMPTTSSRGAVAGSSTLNFNSLGLKTFGFGILESTGPQAELWVWPWSQVCFKQLCLDFLAGSIREQRVLPKGVVCYLALCTAPLRWAAAPCSSYVSCPSVRRPVRLVKTHSPPCLSHSGTTQMMSPVLFSSILLRWRGQGCMLHIKSGRFECPLGHKRRKKDCYKQEVFAHGVPPLAGVPRLDVLDMFGYSKAVVRAAQKHNLAAAALDIRLGGEEHDVLSRHGWYNFLDHLLSMCLDWKGGLKTLGLAKGDENPVL